MRGNIIWSIKEFAKLIDNRRRNEWDSNILVTGETGSGKSHFINKVLLRIDGFKQWKHQVYTRKDTIDLLKNQKMSICWNDELITSGFKRTHYEKEQINLIETLTQYRCNYNVFMGALPIFFTLDKELLKLFLFNIDIISRGIGVIHMRKLGKRYSNDPWDTKINAKLEEKWSANAQKNPNFKIPYHKYTTFIGYIYFNPLTPKQKELYEKIRDKKKKERDIDNDETHEEHKGFYDKLIEMITNKELDSDSLRRICILNDKNIVTVRTRLNQLLSDKGDKERLQYYLKKEEIKQENEDPILKRLQDKRFD